MRNKDGTQIETVRERNVNNENSVGEIINYEIYII